jgi:hypothetical protein
LPITDPAHTEDLLSLLKSGQAALEIREFAARGVLPLESDDRMRALFAVLKDSDAAVASSARTTLAEFPPDAFTDFLRDGRATAAEVDTVASLTDDELVLEQVVRHRSVADSTLLVLARTVSGSPQDALVVNQVRLLRNPALIDALFENPSLTPDARRMLNELREEFFEKEARRRESRNRPAPETPESSFATASFGEEGDEPGETGPEAEPEPADPGSEGQERGAEEVYLRIMKLTVPERVKLALRGSKEERRFLIADKSRMVVMAVLRARGLTITEVESFCTMRHLDDEVFYQIRRKRDWIRRPRIILALVYNPKVPLAITLPMLLRLPLRELRNISRNRNLSEAVRAMAKKTYLQRRK